MGWDTNAVFRLRAGELLADAADLDRFCAEAGVTVADVRRWADGLDLPDASRLPSILRIMIRDEQPPPPAPAAPLPVPPWAPPYQAPTGAIPPETVEWVALTLASGIVGNAGYDGLKRVLSWFRQPPPRPVTQDVAMDLAVRAVQERCRQSGMPVPVPEALTGYADQSSDGRWMLTLREGQARSFFVRVPARKPELKDVVVEVSIRLR
ncbi:hypothetical protein B0I29_119151 [Actinoplanes lutulentus]|uniref:Uncharacterized protein n=2 Tax=Actinoplanes lutulentus TaxID=1287878 RepID=A0A327Z2B0_9ACTN|nr:hypothetical protein B0I29_119151 [Actinoplanes lutulentus]